MKVAPPRRARGNSKSPTPQTSQVPPQINRPAWDDMADQHAYDMGDPTSMFNSFSLPSSMAS